MATKIRKHTDEKKVVRFKRKRRIRAALQGTAERPRLAVFKSNTHLYVQLVDDDKGITLASASTIEKDAKNKLRNNKAGAVEIGKLIAERAKSKNISAIVFDRSGYLYHGRIQALAESARESGLKF